MEDKTIIHDDAVDAGMHASAKEGIDQLSSTAQDRLRKMETLTHSLGEEELDDDAAQGLKVVTEDNRDEFGGIDLIIPTPESIADAEQEYEEAKNELENAMALLEQKEENYRKAHRKLKFLLTGKVPKKETQDLSHQTENNDSEQTGIDNPGELYPDGANSNDVNHDTDSTDYPNTNLIDNPDVENPDNETALAGSEVENHDSSLSFANLTEENPDGKDDSSDDSSANPTSENDEVASEVRKRLRFERRKEWRTVHYTRRNLWRFLIAVLLCLSVFFIYMLWGSNENRTGANEGVKAEEIIEKKKQPQANKDNQQGEELPADEQNDTKPAEKVEEAQTNPQQQQRPKTYILQKGQSLTDISLMFYGTKDSVMTIIRHNNFKNPDKVHVGMEIKLP